MLRPRLHHPQRKHKSDVEGIHSIYKNALSRSESRERKGNGVGGKWASKEARLYIILCCCVLLLCAIDMLVHQVNPGSRSTLNADQDINQCSSPELSVPWILDGQCTEEPYLSALYNAGRDGQDQQRRSCGLCGENAAYLRTLRDNIASKYEHQCKDLVVYGAALGEGFEKMVTSKSDWTVVQRPGVCFFMLISGTEDSVIPSDASSSQISQLIFVDTSKMPYQNNRRNVKVLKFNPGLLFPWADRVIWQDAKLPYKKGFELPSDYMLHFNRTAQYFGTCASFMGLPIHKFSVGNSSKATVRSHCDAIIAAAEARPKVSDSLDSIRAQCNNYQQGRQTPLIDTAFIVYDMRNPTCRKFNGDLGCSWLDEIHCHSDRDQVSFPHILQSMNLNLTSDLDIAGHEHRDQVYVDENNHQRIHIAKRSCHWYFSSFSRCVVPTPQIKDSSIVAQLDHLPPLRPPSKKRIKFAVVVAGTLERYMFTSTLDHVIKPLKKLKGPRIDVDYYVSLTTAKAKAYRSNSGYANYIQSDPDLPMSSLSDYADVEEYIRTNVGIVGGTMGALIIKESIDIDSEPLLKKRRAKALQKHPDEDPDTRFPLIDVRTEEIATRTANANRNLLRMHLAIQNLWSKAVEWERDEGFKYDYVMFMRDDSLWLDDFPMHTILKKKGDIIITSCDARDPPMDPAEINDHILIAKRKVADLFGNYYTTMHGTNLTKCMERLPDTLTKKGKRGCNSEMLLKQVTEERGIKVTKVPQSEVPFQRSANVNNDRTFLLIGC